MGLDMNIRRLNKNERMLKCSDVKGNCDICNGCTSEGMYWRKANAIHSWFVENVQNGVDDCGTYQITLEQLITLRDLCSKVLKNNSLADKLLPTKNGPFFGNTKYNEYYFSNLIYTLDSLEELINEDNGEYSYFYESSW